MAYNKNNKDDKRDSKKGDYKKSSDRDDKKSFDKPYKKKDYKKSSEDSTDDKYKKKRDYKKPYDKNFNKKGDVKTEEVPAITEKRLNKHIANGGICSRREADKLITEGHVTVNGKVVTEMGFKVGRKDKVKVKGK